MMMDVDLPPGVADIHLPGQINLSSVHVFFVGMLNDIRQTIYRLYKSISGFQTATPLIESSMLHLPSFPLK